MPEIQRRKTVTVRIGGVKVGSDAPVVVQSMTNTDTADPASTIQQVAELVEAGSELVRVTVNNDEAARAVPHIVEGLAKRGIHVPIIGDFHYNGHLLLKKYPDCARALAKYRINPGNVSIGRKDDDNFRTMIECAVENDKPVRIGVNWGSLDQSLLTRMMDENSKRPDPAPARDVMLEAMCRSALDSAAAAERYGLDHDKIIISGKVSGVRDLNDVYQMLASRCDYPLHLGLTEAGMGMKGIVASTAGLAPLLLQGIGDTIRVSLTPKPGASRTEEVLTAQQILQSLSIRSFAPQVTACPGCGRTTSTFFQELAQQIQDYLRTSMPIWRQQYPGVEELKLAVMGCVVNGPGESKHANIGISLPGTFEEPKAPVYVDGRLMTTLRGDTIVADFKKILDDYVKNRYGSREHELEEGDSGLSMAIVDDVGRIALQERELVFSEFNEETAWRIGNRLRTLATERSLSVVIDVRRLAQPLFYAALPGTTSDNPEWVRRKSNVVFRFHRSSYAVGLDLEQKNSSVEARGLATADYASHGGSFPIRVENAGLVAAVTVSGLPQRADHELVVEALCAELNQDYNALCLS